MAGDATPAHEPLMGDLQRNAPASTVADVRLGEGSEVSEHATLGYKYSENAGATVLGADATVRSGSIIYGDVRAGDGFMTGHNVLVREHTTLGDDVLVGTNTVVDGETTVGSNVSLQSNVYVPQETAIGDDVFVGPGVVLTNDPYPIRQEVDLEGPTLADSVSVGANATVLPGVSIGERAFVAAGAVVCEDVPPGTLAAGVPATHHELPKPLDGPNSIA
jgi:acetyltransferase-like isoleucine patch superfamily enzyme